MSGSGWSPYACHLALLRPRFKAFPKHKQEKKLPTFGIREDSLILRYEERKIPPKAAALCPDTRIQVFSLALALLIHNRQTKTLRMTLNIDGTPTVSRSHTHPSDSQTSRQLTSSLSLGFSSSPTTLIYRSCL